MESPRNTLNGTEQFFGTPSSTTKTGVVVTPGGLASDGEKADTTDTVGGAKEPHENDVLCGRGGSINSHPGNERFRDLVERRKRVYLTARFKREKRLIANSIVSEIRALNPPGHFLTRDSKTGLWCDIGDEKARDKTSQALRENAPSIRAEIEVEINHQRAEMKRVEEEEEAAHVVQHYGPPPPHYYPQPWGYYPAYSSYGHYPPPAGHEPHRGYSHAPENQGHSPHYQRSFSYEEGSQMSATPSRSPTGSLTSRRGGAHGHYTTPSPRNSRHSETQQGHVPPGRSHSSHSDDYPSKSAFSEIPKFVTSVPSSIAAWTKTSFSFGGNNSGGSSDGHDRPGRPHTKPLGYVHHPPEVHTVDHRDGPRRMVTFEEDRRERVHQKPYSCVRTASDRYGPYIQPTNVSRPELHASSYTPIRHSNSNTNSITPDTDGKSHAIEPHGSTQPFDAVDEHPSLLSQFASNFLGSWDGIGVCANDSTDGHHDQILMQRSSTDYGQQHVAEVSREETYGANEESQEVELLEMMDCDDEIPGPEEHVVDMEDEARTGPPTPQQRRIEIDWPSKMLGCQSHWLPDTFDPPSFFSPRHEEVNSLVQSASLEMEHSTAGMEGFSTNGSIGGGSLCRVFTQDPIDVDAERPISPVGSFNHHVLGPIPSWERSFRSSSTVCSDDDGSIFSKRSEKISSPINAPLSPYTSKVQRFAADAPMAWDQSSVRRK